MHTLLKGLEKIAASADIPMLVAGDFNSQPGSAAHSLLVNNSVDPNHLVRWLFVGLHSTVSSRADSQLCPMSRPQVNPTADAFAITCLPYSAIKSCLGCCNALSLTCSCRSCRTIRWGSCGQPASCDITCPWPAHTAPLQTGAAWTLQRSACGNASMPGIESPR